MPAIWEEKRERVFIVIKLMKPLAMQETGLKKLKEFLIRVPAINPSMGDGIEDTGLWWVKFRIDISHKLAWQVVQ